MVWRRPLAAVHQGPLIAGHRVAGGWHSQAQVLPLALALPLVLAPGGPRLSTGALQARPADWRARAQELEEGLLIPACSAAKGWRPRCALQ